jgi:hypothetical protein
VARVVIAALLLGCALHAQQAPVPAEPPEEDSSLKPREYSFNPVQAKKEIVAGNFYFKKGNYRAAVQRFTEATMWDSGLPEAFSAPRGIAGEAEGLCGGARSVREIRRDRRRRQDCGIA